tara:strand:- start:376 stop:1017 length:642 start_codon:yes stop_codon:yes gene_type:complete
MTKYDVGFTYLIPIIIIVGIWPVLSVNTKSNYKLSVKFVGVLCLYFILEWLNSRYFDINLDGLITYTSLYDITVRLLFFLSLILWYNYNKVGFKYLAGFIFFFLWIGKYVYDLIMVEIGTDLIQYDSIGTKQYIGRKPLYLLLGIFMTIIGGALKYYSIFNPSGIFILIIGGGMLLYNIFFYDTVDSGNYDIRKRASTSEFNERKDLSDGIYD